MKVMIGRFESMTELNDFISDQPNNIYSRVISIQVDIKTNEYILFWWREL